MTNTELLKEQYAEEMFERRANGIETVSFDDWNRIRIARLKFFEEWKNAKADNESIAEAWGV
jgi:hypothetical protein